METIYHFVTSLDAWNDGYNFHSNYFVDEKTFWLAFFTSSAIGLVAAGVFYFHLCNGKTAKYATHSNWFVTLILACIITFLGGNFCYIGGQKLDDNGNEVSSRGFYKSCTEYCNKIITEPEFANNDEQSTALLSKRNDIINALNQGQDVALPFNTTNTVISLLAFVITSFCIKNLTKHGSAIPLKMRKLLKSIIKI